MDQRDCFSSHASDSAEALANNHANDSFMRSISWSAPEDAHLWFIWEVNNGNPPDKHIDASNLATVANDLKEFIPRDVVEVGHRLPETYYAVRVWRVEKRYYKVQPSGPEFINIPRKQIRVDGETITLDPLLDDAERALGTLVEEKDRDTLGTETPAVIYVRVLTKAFETVNEIACALSQYPYIAGLLEEVKGVRLC